MRHSLFALLTLLIVGCKANKPVPTPVSAKSSASREYPPRPSSSAAAFKLFHQQDNTAILVVPDTTPEDRLAALLWQLRDAAEHRGFDQLHLSQKWADSRSPIVFVHVYRGSKCATETYAKGPYPCGASYHGAADFTFGGFSHHEATNGYLVGANGNPQTQLWNPEQGEQNGLKENHDNAH